MNAAEALIGRWKREAELAVEAQKPSLRPWQPGDPAVTDKFSQGTTRITLVSRAAAMPSRWLVKPGDSGTEFGTLFEDEFRRPHPDVDLFSPVAESAPKREWKAGDRVRDEKGRICHLSQPYPFEGPSWWVAADSPTLSGPGRLVNVAFAVLEPEPIREPVIGESARKHEWKLGDAVRVEGGFPLQILCPASRTNSSTNWWYAVGGDKKLAVVNIADAVLDPSPVWEPVTDRRADLIADLRTGGIDAVRKHLPALLQSYGITREEQEAIIAQVEKGEKATRQTASLYEAAQGAIDWQEKESQDRKVKFDITGHVLTVEAVQLPDLATRRIKFCTPVNRYAAGIILDDACNSGSDLTVSRKDDRIVVERGILAD